MPDDRSCRNCRFAVHVDFGYSNYTVEGTTFHCGKKLHPDGEFDEFYGEEKKLKFAEECQGFEAGDGVHMDVDREDEATLRRKSARYTTPRWPDTSQHCRGEP